MLLSDRWNAESNCLLTCDDLCFIPFYFRINRHNKKKRVVPISSMCGFPGCRWVSQHIACKWNMMSWFAVLQVGGSNLNLTRAWWMFAPQIQGFSPDLCQPPKLSHPSFHLLSSFSLTVLSWYVCLSSSFLPFLCPCHPLWWFFLPSFFSFHDFQCMLRLYAAVFLFVGSIHPFKLCFGVILDDPDDFMSLHHKRNIPNQCLGPNSWPLPQSL